ncbi:MAG TPA: SDR family oxidoreductase [Aggregatilineaceae bacterium]|nr:SDR family oxidoreductase [Aggregatilineaceae bacterium]
MQLLILGGTRFLGYHLTERALARGHEVTLFNRGQTNPGIFPQVEQLHGNRDGQLEILRGRRWDAVIDTCGYVPRIVRMSAEALADAVDHYTFISTISVYKDSGPLPLADDSPLNTIEDESTEEVTGETYGALKVLCERAAEAALPGRVLVVRPGLIVGPQDPTPRFPYWVRRIAQGGEVLCPGDPAQRIQFIDVRDLADWTLHLVEQRDTAIYNATGPDYPLTMQAFLETCKTVSHSDAQFTWVSEEFLREHEVQPWSELPIWVPADSAGFHQTDLSRAIGAGLVFHPLADTIRDTLAWDQTRANLHDPMSGPLTPERETALLHEWHAQ